MPLGTDFFHFLDWEWLKSIIFFSELSKLRGYLRLFLFHLFFLLVLHLFLLLFLFLLFFLVINAWLLLINLFSGSAAWIDGGWRLLLLRCPLSRWLSLLFFWIRNSRAFSSSRALFLLHRAAFFSTFLLNFFFGYLDLRLCLGLGFPSFSLSGGYVSFYLFNLCSDFFADTNILSNVVSTF